MQKEFSRVTVIIPCMNESSLILHSIKKIDGIIGHRYTHSDYEIVIVDDGSSDDISAPLSTIKSTDFSSRFSLKLILLKKNVGKDLAVLSATPEIADKSDLVVVIDADGEHPFELIPEMYDQMRFLKDTEQIVGLRRGSNTTQLWRKLGGWVFSRVTSRIKKGVVESDFRIVNKSLLESVYELNEKKVHLRTSFARMSPITHFIEFEVSPVVSEKLNPRISRWGFMKLYEYATISLMKSDHRVSRLLLLTFLLNLFFGALLVAIVLIGTVMSGTRTGTLTILLVNSLFFISNSFFLFAIITYLRMIYGEMQNSPRFELRDVKKIL